MLTKSTFAHDPSAVLDYEFDWSAWLAPGETITSHIVTATGVTADPTSATTTSVIAWISGGTVGSWASVACKITTSSARTDERTINLRIAQR